MTIETVKLSFPGIGAKYKQTNIPINGRDYGEIIHKIGRSGTLPEYDLRIKQVLTIEEFNTLTNLISEVQNTYISKHNDEVRQCNKALKNYWYVVLLMFAVIYVMKVITKHEKNMRRLQCNYHQQLQQAVESFKSEHGLALDDRDISLSVNYKVDSNCYNGNYMQIKLQYNNNANKTLHDQLPSYDLD
eukprot:Pgem_evm1s410